MTLSIVTCYANKSRYAEFRGWFIILSVIMLSVVVLNVVMLNVVMLSVVASTPCFVNTKL
jgi:hypothetical protein